MVRTNLIRLYLAVAMVVFMAPLAQAAFVLGGNTVFGGPDDGFPPPESTADGLVNFAIYQTTSGNWGTELAAIIGDGSTTTVSGGGGYSPTFSAVPIIGSVDYTASYVYMYQVVNTNPYGTAAADASLNSLTITFPYDVASAITSVGYLRDTVFEDPTGVLVGPSTNQKLGPVADGTNPVGGDTPGDGTPTYSQATADIIGLNPAAPAPADLLPAVTATVFPNELRFTLGADELLTNKYTTVMFFTTNMPTYIYSVDNLTDTTHTYGDLPIPNPEPGSFVMVLGAVVCGLGAVVARVRRK